MGRSVPPPAKLPTRIVATAATPAAYVLAAVLRPREAVLTRVLGGLVALCALLVLVGSDFLQRVGWFLGLPALALLSAIFAAWSQLHGKKPQAVALGIAALVVLLFYVVFLLALLEGLEARERIDWLPGF